MAHPLRLSSIAIVTTTVAACSAGLSLGGTGRSHGQPAGPAAPAAATEAEAPAPAPAATKFSDFAYAVKKATGEYYTGWVIDKLTTFHVAPGCYEKMLDEDNGAIHAATFYTRDIAALAKTLTDDDWSAIEAQNNSDRENNKKLVEPMIERFKGSFGLSVTVAGDDCDARMSSLWLRYWTTISSSLSKYPPEGNRVFVNLVVNGDAKVAKVAFDEKTSTYTIVGPRDIEKGAWSETIETAFKRHARESK